MINFKDYSPFVEGVRNKHPEIPYNRFDAKRSEMGGFSRFLVITGIFVATIGAVSMILAPGTTAFYLGSAQALLGVAVIIGTIRKQHQNNSYLQKLPLPEARTAEEYLSLVDIDARNKYGIDITDLLKELEGNIRGEEIYLINGKPIPFDSRLRKRVLEITIEEKLTDQIIKIANYEPDPHLFHTAISHLTDPLKAARILYAYKFERQFVIPETLPDEVELYLNNALFAKITGILEGRYSNQGLLIEVGKRGVDPLNPSASTLIDSIKEGGKWYINVRQILQITFLNNEHPPLYLHAELRVDVEKGLGRLTWESPQRAASSIKIG